MEYIQPFLWNLCNSEFSPALKRRGRTQKVSSPEGTVEFAKQNNRQWQKLCAVRSAVPAGLVRLRGRPGVETPGYFRLRLWREKICVNLRNLRMLSGFNTPWSRPPAVLAHRRVRSRQVRG